MEKRENTCKKNKSNLVSNKKDDLVIPDIQIKEADNYPLIVEESGKIDNLEKLTLHRGQFFLTKMLGGLLSSILLIVLGVGVIKNNWVPWQQMQLFVMTTFSLLLGFYFGRK
jgi:hypothetical protein